MNKKRYTRFIIIVALLVAAGIYLLWRLLTPTPTEVERIFPGDEVVFIETSGLFDAYGALKETRYFQAQGYEPLLEIEQVRKLLDAMSQQSEIFGKGFNADALMSLIGNESGIGIYRQGKGISFLLVSRVKPDFLLMERLFIFAQGNKEIHIAKYRGLRVKDAGIGKGQRIFWALDGDFLILADEREIFFSALNRYLDKERGFLTWVPAFRKLTRERDDGTLISGFVLEKGIKGLPGAGEKLSGAIGGFLPDSFRFYLSRKGNRVALTVRGSAGRDILPDFVSRKTRVIPPDTSGNLMTVSVGAIPERTWKAVAAVLGPQKNTPAPIPLLFPDGFRLLLAPDRARVRPPAVFLVGKRTPFFTGLIEKTARDQRLTPVVESVSGITVHRYDKDGTPYLLWAERGGTVVMSEGSGSLADLVKETLETGNQSGYNEGAGGLSFDVKPRLISDELTRFPGFLSDVIGGFSSTDAERLFTGLIAVDEIGAELSVGGRKFELTVGMRVEDRMP